MNLKEKVTLLLNKIDAFVPTPDNTLPGNTYYLDEDEILCLESERTDARYPYDMDGLNLWVHSNGYIDACESRLTILRTAFFQECSSIDFIGGIRKNEKEWNPISISGVTKQISEPASLKRYTVFERRCAYYICDTEEITFCVRINITSKKQLNFTVCAINKGDKKEIYLASYMDFILRYLNNEDFWGLMSRYGYCHKNGNFTIMTKEDVSYYAVINKTVKTKSKAKISSTVSKNVFTGSMSNSVFNSKALKNGAFAREVLSANTANYPIASDIITFELQKDECAYVNYLVNILTDENEAKKAQAVIISEKNIDDIEKDIINQTKKEKETLSSLEISFSKTDIKSINNNIFNNFIKNVQKQVDLCALGKNYAGAFIGMRDVFQQLDSSLIWNAHSSREKIVKALNHIMSNGRSPRQYSVPPREDMIPDFDMREYIDQGVWIIETLYNYLSFTNDYSILSEECYFYKIIDEEKRQFERCKKQSVLEHLLRITDYLVNSIAEDTGCLRILFGDWNDAVNGLGKTKDENKRYGSGVSVMASAQLYRNLEQMCEILEKTDGYGEKISEYKKIRESLGEALYKNAIQTASDKRRHIIHGWGDKKLYDVGSLCDSDQKCRYSSTVNSFWCISGLINKDISLKSDILKAYEVLDSKYGIRTLTPHFEYDMEGVGGIAHITPGTYENECSYVHATMFAAMALLIMGEGEKAWAQIEKAIPITHNYVTKTPFVMPNSYCHNEEYFMDGESMGDWYTGSGTVLIRNIVKYTLGIIPDLDGIKIMPSYIPSENVSMKLNVKGSKINYNYKKSDNKKFIVNGTEKETKTDVVSGLSYIYLKNEELANETNIEIV